MPTRTNFVKLQYNGRSIDRKQKQLPNTHKSATVAKLNNPPPMGAVLCFFTLSKYCWSVSGLTPLLSFYIHLTFSIHLLRLLATPPFSLSTSRPLFISYRQWVRTVSLSPLLSDRWRLTLCVGKRFCVGTCSHLGSYRFTHSCKSRGSLRARCVSVSLPPDWRSVPNQRLMRLRPY